MCNLKLLLCFLMFNFSINYLISQVDLKGQVFGTINVVETNPKFQKGQVYNKDGTQMMHSNDPLAKSSNNIIVSFHPLTFTPQYTPMEDLYLSQKEQTFLPNVLPFTAGSTIYILNEDEFFHNVYSLTPGSRFNVGRRPPGSPYAITIKKIGPIKLSCDIHPHMRATLLSLDTPYFVRAKETGKYQISGLPVGKYRINVFHPVLGSFQKEISIEANQSYQMDFDLTHSDHEK